MTERCSFGDEAEAMYRYTVVQIERDGGPSGELDSGYMCKECSQLVAEAKYGSRQGQREAAAARFHAMSGTNMHAIAVEKSFELEKRAGNSGDHGTRFSTRIVDQHRDNRDGIERGFGREL